MSSGKNNQQRVIQEQAEKITRLENRFTGLSFFFFFLILNILTI